MGVYTNKWLADYFASKDPDEQVFAIIYDKGEVAELHNGDVEDFEIKDEDWLEIINGMETDYLADITQDTFRNSLHDTLAEFQCQDCFGYDYNAKEKDKGEKICMSCSGEEKEIVY
jgi:hypothetical protein